jgi:hypothetical protein
VSQAKEDWAFVYKCRLCGETERTPFLFTDRFKVIEIMVDIGINGSYNTQHSGAVHKTSLHTCENGGVGISDIQGMVPASNSREVSQ